MKNVILDLDGTILDGKARHYACYMNIVEGHGYTPVDIERYWEMKRARIDLRQLLAASDAQYIHGIYKQAWLDLIEQPAFLGLDRLQPGAVDKLRSWHELGVHLILATCRQHPTRLYEQLYELKLNTLFDTVVVCHQSNGGNNKGQEVKDVLKEFSPSDYLWIGDTEADIKAAHHLGCPVWAVSCGLRTESYLSSLRPDFLSPDLSSVSLNRWRCGH